MGEIVKSFSSFDYTSKLFFQAKLTVLSTKNLKDGNYEKSFDLPLNMCKLHSALSRNIFLKVIIGQFQKSLGAEIRCPLKEVR